MIAFAHASNRTRVPPEVRIECLRELVRGGFNANVMMEPYLRNPVPLIPRLLDILRAVRNPDIAGTIAIGQMNYANTPETKSVISSADECLALFNAVRAINNQYASPRIFFKKDSVFAILKALIRS